MIKNDDILSILKQNEETKTALLEDVLIAVQKAETVFDKKKAEADEVKGRSATVEEDIVNLLNNHIRRLETEKSELSMEVEAARDDLKQIDGLRAQMLEAETELGKVKAEVATAVQDRDDANEKLMKIQAQWERIAGS